MRSEGDHGYTSSGKLATWKSLRRQSARLCARNFRLSRRERQAGANYANTSRTFSARVAGVKGFWTKEPDVSTPCLPMTSPGYPDMYMILA